MFSKNKQKLATICSKGFTLIELIIVIAIVGIVSTVSWNLMSGVKKATSVQNTCEQVAAMINKTRNYALSGKTIGGSSPNTFRINIVGTYANIVGVYHAPPNKTMETFNFPGGVSCTIGGAALANYEFWLPYGTCASGNCSINTICWVAGVQRTIKVTPNSAVCQ